MKDKASFENFSDNSGNENTSDDPIKTLENRLETYSSEEYSDPELKNKTWCSYMERGFRASRNIK